MFSHSKESYTHGKDWADNLLPTPDSFLVCMYVCNVTNGFTFQTELSIPPFPSLVTLIIC